MTTERPSPRYAEIDSWDASDALEAMIDGQFAAVAAVRTARSAIEAAARAMEARLRYRGRLIYVGAGTSGRLAVQDGAELMPTFSWPSERLLLIMAGGAPAFTRSIEGAEDQVEDGIALIRRNRTIPSGSIPARSRSPARRGWLPVPLRRSRSICSRRC